MNRMTLIIVMATLYLNFNSQAQNQSTLPLPNKQAILGKVISTTSGEALPRAVIKIMTPNHSTISNDKGEFILTLSNGTYNISISHIGYKTKNINIQIPLKEQLIIKMETDDKNLQEVEINAGYYTVKDKERTGSISKVTAETISKQPVSNPLAALIGRMPGVQIQQTTGFSGGTFKISIRGQNSLRPQGNAPFYIINGIPFIATSIASGIGGNIIGVDPLSSLNPNDIESIEILKDADATAIYGTRGANGVVLITTKTGKSTETLFELNIYNGIARVPHFMELLNTTQYLEMRHEAFLNDNKPIKNTDYDLNGTWITNSYTDWQKELIGGTANTNDIQLGVSGGNNQNNFLLKAGNHRETTVLPVNLSDYKYSVLLNTNHASLNKKFNANISVSYLKDDNKLVQYDPTYDAIILPPNAPFPFNNEDGINWENGTWDNPYAKFNSRYFGLNKTLIANALLSYQLLTNLKLRANVGYTDISLDERNIIPTSFYSPNLGNKSGSANFSNSNMTSWIAEPQLEYQKHKDKNHLNILIGSTFQKNKSDNQILNATGFTTDAMLGVISAATQINILSANQTLYKYNAIFGRINYSFDEKYIINLTGRRDGSSRFGPGNQFANFYALGTSWIFSKEQFIIKHIPFMSFGKLRVSYGITGSDQIGDYGFYDLWKPTKYSYGNTGGIYPANLFNSTFAWERNTKFESELNIGLFNDKIIAALTYYKNLSGNQLVGFPLPATTGFSVIQSNLAAKVQNTGIEIEINTKNLHNKNFSWSTSFNISLPKNRLIAFPDIQNTNYSNTLEVGKSTSLIRTYKYLGIDNKTGIYLFEDKNADGNLTPSGDYQSLVERSQKYYGGLQNILNYKGWSLTIFVQFVKQTGLSYLNNNFSTPGFIGNQPNIIMNRWRSEESLSEIQKFTQSITPAYISYQRNINSDHKITDASYVRLKNVAMSYDFPIKLANKVYSKKIRVYAQGQNLLTLSNYIGLDPETQGTALPPLRALTMGIQLIF